MSKLILSIFILSFNFSAIAGNSEEGLFNTNYYPAENLPSGYQVWSIEQSDRGLMYMATNGSLVQFDGDKWLQVKNTGNEMYVNLKKSSDNKIYAAGVGVIGYVVEERTGYPVFVSLLDNLSPEQRAFSEIFKIHEIDDRIYFVAHEFILVKDKNNHFTMLKPPVGSITTSTIFKDDIWLYIHDSGLFRVKDEHLHKVSDTKDTVQGHVYSMAAEESLVLSSSAGLYKFNGQNFERFPTQIDEFFQQHDFDYRGLRFHSNGLLGVILRAPSVYLLIDKSGKIVQRFQANSSFTVISSFEDVAGDIWIGLEGGIIHVEFNTVLTDFSFNSGLRGNPQKITRFKGNIYASTTEGVFKLTKNVIGEDKFNQIQGVSTSCFRFEEHDQTLYVGCANGIYKIENEWALKNLDFAIYDLEFISGGEYALVGTPRGLALLKEDKEKLVLDKVFELNVGAVVEIFSMPNEEYWLVGFDRVTVVQLKRDSKLTVEVLASSQAFIENGGWTVPLVIDGKSLLVTQKGIYVYSSSEAKFSPYGEVADLDIDKFSGMEYVQKVRGGEFLLANTKQGKVYLGKIVEDNKIKFVDTIFSRDSKYKIYSFYVEGSVVWACGVKGGLLVEKALLRQFPRQFEKPTFKLIEHKDSSGQTLNEAIDDGVSPQYSAFSISYVLPAYHNFSANQYRYKLDGVDETWSKWRDENETKYTNLSAGNYKFNVQGKDTYGTLSQISSYDFVVLTPWYKSYVAYFIYAVAIIAGLVGVFKWRSARLKRANIQLKSIVEEKTAEVVLQKELLEESQRELILKNSTLTEKNRQIEQQSRQLQELDETKSRFFTNISHEFRTPLTMNIGPLEDMLSGKYGEFEPGTQKVLEVMHRNAKRLLGFINELLEVAKLSSSQVSLNVQKHDLIALLRQRINAFSPLLNNKNIGLSFNTVIDELWLLFDLEMIVKVIDNLISNAAKHSPQGEVIVIRVTADECSVYITVTDNGPGIPEEQLQSVFDRFYQADTQLPRQAASTGIGLALAKELILLHHGEITVENGRDKGCIFTVSLLLGEQHFSEDEIEHSNLNIETNVDINKDACFNDVQILSATPETNNAATDSISKDKSLLVVEDNQDLRQYIADQFRPNYHVYEAVDGVEGLAVAQTKQPDIIISDVNMPNMDGKELCRQLKQGEVTSHIPILLLTANVEEQQIIAGLKSGANDYLTKPFNSQELLLRVSNQFQLIKQQQKYYQKQLLLNPRDIKAESLDDTFVKKLMSNIEKYHSNSQFGVEWLADTMALSRRQLSRKAKSLTGRTPSEILANYRLERAADLLLKNSGKVSTIAFNVGFNNLVSFGRAFKQKYGVSPTEYLTQETGDRRLQIIRDDK
ncbi:hybrid sensor histidine kinase/response regulator transcription factor [Aliikangiella sp. G2MR2-5]|uniref:hybrid sensor histidine kinase/response regulator transcription factor n=1 Tax=Aliikangiella sp. G2MR2-5 TaxID=2788943 RepID=UPI0018A9998D|nr:hybrid sensor histidine kinase/response regulator transcription factor [Aliikangiella sp. G2MR2-5]